MDFLILEVDGSLANPYAAGAVALWTVCLSALAIWLVRSGTRTRRRLSLLFILGLVATKPAQLLIGNLLYQVVDPRITNVGFWGGPPIWIAPAVSCGIGWLASVYIRRRRHRQPLAA